jgi:hypothetical protein
MDEPGYTPVVPGRPVRLQELRLRAFFEAGGRPALWDEVRRALVEAVGSRGRSPEGVRALRAWVDLEQGSMFAHYLRQFRS